MSITPPPQPRTPTSKRRPSAPHGNAPSEASLPVRIGPYRIVREIGAGGMGTVYLAEDGSGNRLAVKLALQECVADELSIKRFYREARSARRVEHPNVCAVRDVGQDGDRYFLAMDWIDGQTLAQVLKTNPSPPPANALRLVATLADALQTAHDAGIIHRDLKPSNIMIQPDGQPVIIDFGTARRFDDTETLLTLTSSIVGTPGYMAPEQITGAAGEIGPACDVYALGVILYELLAGHPPFSGNFATILGSIVSELPPPLTVQHPEIEPVLEALCLRALEKVPTHRYKSARQFGEVIATYLQDGPQAASSLLASRSPSFSMPKESPTVPTPGLLARCWAALFGRR